MFLILASKLIVGKMIIKLNIVHGNKLNYIFLVIYFA